MTRSEKILLHQVHPAKLAADIGGEAAALYFFWQHLFWVGLIAAFAPAIIASAILLQYARLDGYATSRIGLYLKRHMTHAVEAARLAGALLTLAAAWWHRPWLIVLGVAVVAGAWASGL
ncbi:MAG: hypothetical protein ABUL43_00950, partial [Hyphomicrobium sp.]